MSNKTPNTKGLLNYAKKKTENTLEKVESSLKQMVKQQQFINFNTVAKASGVSKAFLYRNAALRERIETLRRQQHGLSSPSQVKRNLNNDSKDVIITALRKRINALEKENKQLKDQLNTHLKKIYQEI